MAFADSSITVGRMLPGEVALLVCVNHAADARSGGSPK
jgi:hypothetical protein